MDNDPDIPDLSIYRQGINSHLRCTFNCENLSKLITISRTICCKLLMDYKFLIKYNARMCSNHVDNSTFWPLVKQITKEVSAEEQKTVSDLMFIYYQELKGKNEKIFDVNNIDSIDNTTFKNWFALDKEQF